uniref:Nebulette n=1 Tax=Meleagris gallopavo TaxID=9103 RepID=A0A803YQX4_MELGA
MRTCTCNANILVITFSFWEIKVFYKKMVGAGTAVKETPEIERVKKNQQNISSVHYKEQLCKATPVSVTPEIERVKRNQENVSMVHYREQPGKATAVSITPEIERVKKNQDNISSASCLNLFVIYIFSHLRYLTRIYFCI